MKKKIIQIEYKNNKEADIQAEGFKDTEELTTYLINTANELQAKMILSKPTTTISDLSLTGLKFTND